DLAGGTGLGQVTAHLLAAGLLRGLRDDRVGLLAVDDLAGGTGLGQFLHDLRTADRRRRFDRGRPIQLTGLRGAEETGRQNEGGYEGFHVNAPDGTVSKLSINR